MPDTLGIDKLAFLLAGQNVKFSPDCAVEVDRKFDGTGLEPLDNGILYYVGKHPVRGRAAYLNTKNYHFDIRHDRFSTEPICRLHFSGNAFSDNNLEPLGRDHLQDVAQMVERDLADNGVKLVLSSARVTRVDIAQNVPVSVPVPCFDPVFAALRMRKSVNKRDYGGTGFLASNTRWQANFYDKGAEMAGKGRPVELCPKNTLRPELRLLKGEMVKDTLGISTLSELRASWPELRPTYNRIMERDIFRSKLETKKGASVDPARIARYVRASGCRYPWRDFTSTYGLAWLIVSQGEAMALHIATSELGYDPGTGSGQRQLNRIRNEINTLAFALSLADTTEEGHKVVTLYEELKEGVLRMAA